jgi:hypothetical protein
MLALIFLRWKFGKIRTRKPAMCEPWETGIKAGYETKTVQVGNCTVRVHRPILDSEERSRREEQVRDALRGLIKKGV